MSNKKIIYILIKKITSTKLHIFRAILSYSLNFMSFDLIWALLTSYNQMSITPDFSDTDGGIRERIIQEGNGEK